MGFKKMDLLIIVSSLLLLNACTASQMQIESGHLNTANKNKNQSNSPRATPPPSIELINKTSEYHADNRKTIEDQILVISTFGAKPISLKDKELKTETMVSLKHLSLNVALLSLNRDKLDKNALNRKVNQLKKEHPDFYIQPNYIYYLGGKENSTRSSIPQYALKMTGVNNSQNNKGKSIKIALIDTPVDLQHPALKNASIKSYNYVQSRGKRHATAIAGILVGSGRIKGVAPQAKLISIGAFNEPSKSRSLGLSTSFILAKAFNKALDEKVDIINLSFGSTEVDPLMKRLANRVIQQGIIMLASVGNDNHQTSVRYPASLRGVYAITAIDEKSRIYKRANTGTTVDYALPGVGILTTKPKGKYTSVTGTSFATAYATGIFALQLSQKAAINKLNSKVKDLGKSGKDPFFGRGLIRY